MQPPKGMSEPPLEADARRCYSRALKLDDKATFVNRIKTTFEAIGLPLAIDSQTSDRINEANAVRNALLHRGGLIDAFEVLQAPALKPREGTTFEVTEAYVLAAFGAVSGLANQLLRSVTDYARRCA